MSSGRGAGMDPTLGDVSAKKKRQNSAEAEATREFLRLASDRGLSLTGPDGLLKQFTKTVLETTSLRRQLVAATGSAYGRKEELLRTRSCPSLQSGAC